MTAYRTGAAIALMIGLLGCGSHTHEHAEEHPELADASFTRWTEQSELFMEHPALLVGEPAKFLVHLTRLSDFAPVTAGTLTLRLEPRDGSDPVVVTQATPRSAGIYGPVVEPPRAGTWDLVLRIDGPDLRDEFRIADVVVHPNAETAPRAATDAAGGISFLKEQQWVTPGFRTAFAENDSVVETFEAPAHAHPAAGRFAEVSAPIDAIVEFESARAAPVPGAPVDRRQLLVRLTPVLGDAGSTLANARRELREAEDEYARVKRLIDVEAVPERRVHEARIRLEAAHEAIAGLSGGALAGGALELRAPLTGIVSARTLAPGRRIDAGTSLFRIVDPSVLWLEVRIPAARRAEVVPESSARFQVEGSERVYETARMVSLGTTVDPTSRTVEILYEVQNPDGSIPIGAHALARVATGEEEQGVVIPESAIVDDSGQAVAYAQNEGESFERRELVLGATDGERRVVRNGIEPGERVVVGAAYQVRLASLSTAVPAHGHEH